MDLMCIWRDVIVIVMFPQPPVCVEERHCNYHVPAAARVCGGA